MGATNYYGWIVPNDGGSADEWGAILLTLFDAIDYQVKTVENLAINAGRTGAIMDFLATSAPSGWIEVNGTIGDASSSATYANVLCEDLYEFLWGQFSNSVLQLYNSNGTTSDRGASAALDWAAHKRLSLPDQRDRFRRSYKSGGSSGAIGVPQLDQIANHTHPFGVNYGSGLSTSSYVQPSTSSIDSAYSGVTSNPSSGAGSETRPSNIAYLTCIKL